MMANAARDPYWQASLRAETLAHPELNAVYQDTYMACHNPMPLTTSKISGNSGLVLDDGYHCISVAKALGIDNSDAINYQIAAGMRKPP